MRQFRHSSMEGAHSLARSDVAIFLGNTPFRWQLKTDTQAKEQFHKHLFTL